VQAQVQNFLHVGRVQRRNAQVKQHRLGLAGQRRAFATGVVPHNRQHTPVFADAGVVGVFEGVARAVYAWRLAVPHAGDTIEFLLAHGVQHLGAPDGGGGQVFVQAVNKMDVMFQQQLLLLEQGGVEHAHRRAAVTRDKHAGLETAARIGTHLVQTQAHQGVDATQMYFTLGLVKHGCQILFGRHVKFQ